MTKRRKSFDLTEAEKKFVFDNLNKLSNATMAKMLNINFSTFSGKVHDLGLKRFTIQSYWTEEQTNFLIDNFHAIGNVELAKIYNNKWPREKAWTIKHIEKKLVLLNLKRTEEDLKKIKQRNINRGSWKNMTTWDTRGAFQTGSVRVWHLGSTPSKVIKTDIGYLIYSRWLYEKHFGPVPPGHIVTFKDQDPMNVVPENLIAVERGKNCRRGNRKYPVELRELEKILKQLNKTLKQKV